MFNFHAELTFLLGRFLFLLFICTLGGGAKHQKSRWKTSDCSVSQFNINICKDNVSAYFVNTFIRVDFNIITMHRSQITVSNY